MKNWILYSYRSFELGFKGETTRCRCILQITILTYYSKSRVNSTILEVQEFDK